MPSFSLFQSLIVARTLRERMGSGFARAPLHFFRRVDHKSSAADITPVFFIFMSSLIVISFR